MADADEPGHRGSGIPIPRYPFFIRSTSSNWFRTTINPLVWELVPHKALPVPLGFAVQQHVLWESGLWIDIAGWTRTIHPTVSIERRIVGRPDALFDREVMLELFGLLTSGWEKDRERASEALRAIGTAHAGREPEVLKASEDFKLVKMSGPAAKRRGRGDLVRALRVQQEVWSERVSDPKLSEGEIARRVSRTPGDGRGERNVRRHLADFEAYAGLLVSNPHLEGAWRQLYGEDPMQPDGVALQTLEDALDWLGSGEP